MDDPTEMYIQTMWILSALEETKLSKNEVQSTEIEKPHHQEGQGHRKIYPPIQNEDIPSIIIGSKYQAVIHHSAGGPQKDR